MGKLTCEEYHLLVYFGIPYTQFVAQIYHTFRPDRAIFRCTGLLHSPFLHSGQCLHIGSVWYVGRVTEGEKANVKPQCM
jgi:hypothetical protein